MSATKWLDDIQGKDTSWVSENISEITEQTDFCAQRVVWPNLVVKEVTPEAGKLFHNKEKLAQLSSPYSHPP